MRKYTHLSITDRRLFYTLLEMGLSMADIAERLARNRSTLYRELERNTEPEGYLPRTAQQKAEERARGRRPGKLQTDGILGTFEQSLQSI